MRKASLRNALLPCSPLQVDLNDEEFYYVESTGASVTLASSVSLIYFYCSRLPSDWLVYSSLLIFIFHAAMYVHNLLSLRLSVYLTSCQLGLFLLAILNQLRGGMRRLALFIFPRAVLYRKLL
jgi:hypothetical protein